MISGRVQTGFMCKLLSKVPGKFKGYQMLSIINCRTSNSGSNSSIKLRYKYSMGIILY